MIKKKRLIFDLDNTLIMWQDKYLNAIKETIEEYNLNLNYIEVNNLIDQYENEYSRYDKRIMLNKINKFYNMNLQLDFIETWLNKIGKMADYNENTYKTLEYLSKEYELVVLTNWFKTPQIERLKTAKIYKFFSHVYAGEKYLKPSNESFKEAIGSYKKSDCIMIGDDLGKDIKGALKFGINAIWLNNKNILINNNKIKEITSFKELMNIL